MNQPSIDPSADPSRRAWLACPNCDHGAGCAECQSRRNCGTHWQYLLKNTASRVFLQCPTCFCMWTVDTAERDRQAHTRPGHDGVVATEISLRGRPRDIVTSPSGEFVYVLNDDSVQAVDHRHRVVATIPIARNPGRC